MSRPNSWTAHVQQLVGATAVARGEDRVGKLVLAGDPQGIADKLRDLKFRQGSLYGGLRRIQTDDGGVIEGKNLHDLTLEG